MASYYVRSAAAGSANGTNWANAYTTLAVAMSGKGAGDIFYLAADHVENTTGSSIGVGNNANPAKVICVDHTGSVPPVAADLRTTAQVKTTADNSILFNNSTDWFGIVFVAGASTGNPSINTALNTGCSHRFTNCSLQIGSTGSGAFIAIGGTAANAGCELYNTTVSFTHASQQIRVNGRFAWRATPSALLGTIPTTLFTLNSSNLGCNFDCIGVDLSAAGSGKTLVNVTTASSTFFSARFLDCKLDAAVTKLGTPTSPGAAEVEFVRTGSTGVNYVLNNTRYSGTLDHETSIVRTGGASDGTTSIAWKIVTTANSNWAFPFVCPPIAIWNDTVGSSVTATIQGIWGGGAVPNDDEIWVEVEYLGSSTSPQGSFVNDSKATVLTTAAAQSAGTGTWGGSTTKFALGVTFTPQQAGWIYCRVKCAKPSSTFYIDPLCVLS